MDLFYILKLNVSTILENKCNITTTFDSAKSKGWVVSIGDNQVLKFLRDIKCIDFDKQKNKVDELYKARNTLKNLPKSEENGRLIRQYQSQIDDLLYLPDLISVRADTTKAEYKLVAKNKFKVNNITYKRLCAGAGQLRRNTALFVNEKLYEELTKIMLCGLDSKRIGKINLAKFSAYHSLYASSTSIITTPRVCVVKDYEMILHDQNVEWIYKKENGERDIEPRTIDLVQNVWDGSGLVSIEMAEQWNQDLNIDTYSPSAYIVRSAWIKGLCVCMDWKRYAREVAHKDTITDAWGNEKNVDDIDVILSTSQFKMWRKYKDWEEYMFFHQQYGHIWGCSRVNKEHDNDFTPLNYQYIQSNSFTEERIKELADFSIDWIKQVGSGDRLSILLYLLGCHECDKKAKEVEENTGMNIVKALMYDESILNDTYVRSRIYKSIEKRINQLKIGKLLIEGSYEFAIVDPYMFMEYVFEQEPKGLLKAGQLWNQRWVDKGSKEVAVLRSPLVAPNENQVLQVYSDEKCNEWFAHITSGVIINGHDTTLMRASDGDTDGDLLLTCDNFQFTSSVDKSLLPITYEKATVKEQTISYNNLVDMDTKSFNTKIGVITNLATSLICLRERFKKDSVEYIELTRRINLLRFHQGSAIDAGKGNVYIAPPSSWHKRVKIDYKNDSKEVIDQKKLHNRLVGDKKSYFMCYIYPSVMKRYKWHKRSSDQICRAMFGCRLNDILQKEVKTKREKYFEMNYYKYLPVFINKSTMNVLCKYVEKADFDLKFFKSYVPFDYTVLLNKHIQIDRSGELYQQLLSVIKKYHNIYEMNVNERRFLEEDYSYVGDVEDEDDEYSTMFNTIENELFELCSNKHELCNYIIDIMYNAFKSKSKAILWNICGKEIVENLKAKNLTAYFPVETDTDYEIEYLGKKYKLQEVLSLDNI